MDGTRRWIGVVIAAAAIVALIVFARGVPQHGPATPATLTEQLA